MFLNTLRGLSVKSLTRQITKTPHTSSGIFGKSIVLPKYSNYGSSSRVMSTLQSKMMPGASAGVLTSKEDVQEFVAIFPDIVRDLTEAGRHSDIPEVYEWFAKVLQHNVSNGKKSRGLTVVTTYKMLEDPNKLTPENIKLANIMGWCVEMLQAYFLVLDDIMDSSITRRGAPCWYTHEGVGLTAINDAILIENGLYSILRQHFSKSPAYVPSTELFHDVTLKTAMGEDLDNKSKHNGEPNLDGFTMSRYNSIVKYKSAYYGFQLPVALGMYLANIFDAELHRQATTILLEIGQFFQIQDDFIDAFGDPAITGKIGTDIQEGKCSWFVVVALQRATQAQKETLKANYGKSDQDSIKAVKNLYEELGLRNIYTTYEEETLNLIGTHIKQISKGLPHELFFKILNNLYKRGA